MEAPAPEGVAIIGVVAALAMPTVQILQGQRRARGLEHRSLAGCAWAWAGETERQKRRTATASATPAAAKTLPNINAKVLCGKTA